jgi:hypothetical protein
MVTGLAATSNEVRALCRKPALTFANLQLSLAFLRWALIQRNASALVKSRSPEQCRWLEQWSPPCGRYAMFHLA